MKNLIAILLICLFANVALAQKIRRKPYYSREISMSVDNDIFFFIDYYYTAGQDIQYRRLVNPSSGLYRLFNGAKKDSSKLMIQYHAGYKIFTPYNIDYSDTKTMDRPYAGWSSVSVAVANFATSSRGNSYELEAGLVGPVSGMGKVQRWVHRQTNFEVPKGWNSEIRNELVINAYYNHSNSVSLGENVDMVTQANIQAGTGGNRISPRATFRWGQFNPINNSAFTQSRLSWDNRKQGKSRKQEIFVFLGLGGDYVLSNIFIEGSLFPKNKSSFTVPIQHFVVQGNLGIMYSSHAVSWSTTWYHLAKETKQGFSHDYADLALAIRF